jgi:hypothetical protein
MAESVTATDAFSVIVSASLADLATGADDVVVGGTIAGYAGPGTELFGSFATAGTASDGPFAMAGSGSGPYAGRGT